MKFHLLDAFFINSWWPPKRRIGRNFIVLRIPSWWDITPFVCLEFHIHHSSPNLIDEISYDKKDLQHKLQKNQVQICKMFWNDIIKSVAKQSFIFTFFLLAIYTNCSGDYGREEQESTYCFHLFLIAIEISNKDFK